MSIRGQHYPVHETPVRRKAKPARVPNKAMPLTGSTVSSRSSEAPALTRRGRAAVNIVKATAKGLAIATPIYVAGQVGAVGKVAHGIEHVVGSVNDKANGSEFLNSTKGHTEGNKPGDYEMVTIPNEGASVFAGEVDPKHQSTTDVQHMAKFLGHDPVATNQVPVEVTTENQDILAKHQ